MGGESRGRVVMTDGRGAEKRAAASFPWASPFSWATHLSLGCLLPLFNGKRYCVIQIRPESSC